MTTGKMIGIMTMKLIRKLGPVVRQKLVITQDTLTHSHSASNYTETLKKSGMFGKSSDSYILGLGNKEKLSEHEIVHIAYVENFCYWQTNHQRYTVIVASPKKESKFKGMKTFIAYQLTPSFNNISVSFVHSCVCFLINFKYLCNYFIIRQM